MGMRAYYGQIVSEMWWNIREQVIISVFALIFVIITLLLQFKFGLIEPGRGWRTAFLNTMPTIGILVLYLLYHLVRVPYKLDGKAQARIQVLQAEVDANKVSEIVLTKLVAFANEGRKLREKIDSPQSLFKGQELIDSIAEWEARITEFLGKECSLVHQSQFADAIIQNISHKRHNWSSSVIISRLETRRQILNQIINEVRGGIIAPSHPS